jgi:hypothetical protein
VPDHAPWDVTLTAPPDWLLDLASQPEPTKPSATVTSLRAVREGARNRTLFSACLRQARACDSEADLLDVALTINADFMPPLAVTEVRLTVASAWSYETKDRNWVGKAARVYTSADDLNAFRAHPNWADALALDTVLRLEHGAREGPFAVSPRAMAAANILPGWSPNRIRAARSTCLQMGRLTLTHKGGSRRGDPSLYVLGQAARYGV